MTQQCAICKEVKEFKEFRKCSTSPTGYYTRCRDCASEIDTVYDATTRMYVNGKRIPKSHPLWKPGRYKALDDAWSHTEIDQRSVDGEVYIVRSPAHPNWLKVGKAVNSEERLNGYQTASPHRDYVLEYYEYFENRHQAESAIHRMLEKHKDCHDRKNEWFKTYIPTIKEVMNEYRDSLRHRDQQHPQQDLVLCN